MAQGSPAGGSAAGCFCECGVDGPAIERPGASAKDSGDGSERKDRRSLKTDQLERELPPAYKDKVQRLGLSLVSDNTLRRVQAGVRTYPRSGLPFDRAKPHRGGWNLTE